MPRHQDDRRLAQHLRLRCSAPALMFHPFRQPRFESSSPGRGAGRRERVATRRQFRSNDENLRRRHCLNT